MSKQITIFTKDDCGECVKTKKIFARKSIPHATVHVADDDTDLIEKLRTIATQQGIQPTMPMVQVTDIELGETETWFGHRPDLVLKHITNLRRD